MGFQISIKSSERTIHNLGFSVGISNVYFILEGIRNVYFTLFSPWNGLCTIRGKAGTSNWVLVYVKVHQELYQAAKHRFLPFSQNA